MVGLVIGRVRRRVIMLAVHVAVIHRMGVPGMVYDLLHGMLMYRAARQICHGGEPLQGYRQQ